ncbi:MAG: sigma-54-dependent Fis family transcriptional regulator [Gemmatimonadetes bacterium]|nr:sigma-54-dependent Fis family transcriptional regulator [Gemmatimonadota bacterium]
MVRFVVVRLSESFADVWHQLAAGLDAEVQILPAADTHGVPPAVSAVLLAAGGAEREALDWLDRHDTCADVPIFVVGADPGRRMTAQVMGHGAADYFALPEDIEILRNAIGAAVARHRQQSLHDPMGNSEDEMNAFTEIVGESPSLKAVLLRAARLLPHAHGNALIVGETGTGKELLARAIHKGGPRRAAPFVPVNCSALPANLIESELFGHEKGAFTDAHAAKPGLFEIADGGTLLLDEISAFPVDLQAKLLRALEDHEIRRVGGTKSRKVDVRVIAAANEDLAGAVQRGTFRQDLYFRLSVVTLVLPPLRERGADVGLIADHLLASLAARHGLPVPSFNGDARRALLEHAWPGNIRELKNALERALLLSLPGELSLTELLPAAAQNHPAAGVIPFPAHLDTIAAAAGRAMLEACEGNVSEAARRLNVSRRRLRRLVQPNGESREPSPATGTR